MPIGSCQLFGYFVAILSTIFIVGVSIYPGWQVSDEANNSNDIDPRSYGLFWSCRDGAYSKKDFLCNKLGKTHSKLPLEYQISRILMVCACASSLLSISITPIGLQCTILGGDATTKCIIARIGSVLILFAGIFCFVTSIVYGEYVRSRTIQVRCKIFNQLSNEEIDAVTLGQEKTDFNLKEIRDILFCHDWQNSVPTPESFIVGPAIYILFALSCLCLTAACMLWVGSYNIMPWMMSDEEYENIDGDNDQYERGQVQSFSNSQDKSSRFPKSDLNQGDTGHQIYPNLPPAIQPTLGQPENSDKEGPGYTDNYFQNMRQQVANQSPQNITNVTNTSKSNSGAASNHTLRSSMKGGREKMQSQAGHHNPVTMTPSLGLNHPSSSNNNLSPNLTSDRDSPPKIGVNLELNHQNSNNNPNQGSRLVTVEESDPENNENTSTTNNEYSVNPNFKGNVTLDSPPRDRMISAGERMAIAAKKSIRESKTPSSSEEESQRSPVRAVRPRSILWGADSRRPQDKSIGIVRMDRRPY